LGSRWLNFIQALLEERARMKKSDDVRDLFDLLVNARDPESGEGFTRRQLRDQFATMIIAGHETSSITLMWALIMTARSKALRDVIAAEVETLMDGEAITAKKVERMRVTRATVMETLRLFPPVFLIVREAKRPIRLAGRILFKGDVVSIAPWTLHRHERHWQAPTLFNPERFLDDAKTPARYTFMPFGAGPRICIGMSFSLTEITAVLGLLLRNFRFEIVSEEPIVPRAVLATYPDPLPQYRVRQRNVTRKAA
jgi:unspecific monooxygenase